MRTKLYETGGEDYFIKYHDSFKDALARARCIANDSGRPATIRTYTLAKPVATAHPSGH